MLTPSALLKFTAKALLHVMDSTPDGGIGGDSSLLAEVIWVWWSQTRDAEARYEELVTLGDTAPHELKRAVREVLGEVAVERTQAVRSCLGFP